ncbi:MAG: hypothetical protein R2788_08035 [Saprospiraceae bacterium]
MSATNTQEKQGQALASSWDFGCTNAMQGRMPTLFSSAKMRTTH